VTGRTQIDALTGIRGIAAWLIVLYHIRLSFAPSVPEWVTAALGKGYLAVDLFFVLSGFVLWLTWGERLRRERWRAMPDFLRKRIARIWPLHAFILAATVGFALVIAATGREVPGAYKWHELPLHFLLIQNWGFTPDIGWNDPSWSISTELAAYLAMAVLVPLLALVPLGKGSDARRIVAAIVAILLLALALDRFFAAFGAHLLGDDIAFFGLARCLAQFGCGVAMCVLWRAADSAKFRAVTAVVALTLAVAWSLGASETLVVPVAFAAFVGLLASTSARPGNPLSSRGAVFLGEISYSTYLAHFLLWKLFKLAFVSDAENVPLPLVALFLVLALAASVVLYHLVEVPARDLIGRRRGRGSPTVLAAPMPLGIESN
jgi:peptidoglycan/LPS O-acetylase OafA/YrhL